jgi:tetratricopeptide (TPR) repeat protein
LKVEEPITITVFTAGDNPDQSTTELNGDFLHSLLLIDALLLLKPNENDKKTLMTFVQNKYKGREKEITNLKKFESTYSPDEVLWWYSYQTVLYKILNEALRMQNIDSLLLFRFFIADIYDQLKQNQYDSPIQVYRGQLMSINELKKLEKSKGKLISINSFFSTSRVRNKAMRFLEEAETSSDLCLVLFTIDADPKVVTTKPFADISSFAEYKDEAEVLFMIACIFRLDSIHQRKDDRWEIHMTLCGDDVHDLKELYEHTKNEYWGNDQEIDLITFGEVLYHMGKYSSAEKLYLRMLQDLPADNLSLSKLYYHLGMIAYKKEDYNSSLTWYDKSLKIILKINSSNYTNIGELYNCIGEAHRGKNDYDQALEWHKKGIECLKNAHQENHPTMGILYNNIGLIYQGQENYAEALKYYKKSLTINEKYLPPGHADMATLHHNLSIVYGYLSQYDLAIEHHNKSLEIKLKAFPSSHPSIADSYQSIGCLYYDKGEWKQALKNFQKAADIYHHSLSSDHPKVLRIESNIERVKSKLK